VRETDSKTNGRKGKKGKKQELFLIKIIHKNNRRLVVPNKQTFRDR